MNQSLLRAYMVSGIDPSEGAALVFAYSAKQAKQLGDPVVSDWGVSYIDLRVKWMKGKEKKFLNQYATSTTEPHVIDNPPYCNNCELWGGTPLNNMGVCQECELDF